jgi:hypothetical protein
MLVFLLPITALALSPVLFASFIRLDDYSHLFENPQLRRMSVSGLTALWAKSYFKLYIPVTYSVWWALSMIGSLFGELQKNPWIFHSFNLAVHLANVTLAFFVVRTLIRIGRRHTRAKDTRAKDTRAKDGAIDDGIALVSALLFALHPVQVETVAWVSELKGELAALFGFLGLFWHFRSNKRIFTAVFFIVAMLSKPSAIVFPGIVFVIDRILLQKSLAKSAIAPALYGVPLLILAIVTKHLQPDSEQDFIPTIAQRLVVASDTISFYVSKVLVPFPLAVDYGRTPELVLGIAPSWVGYSILLSAVGVAPVLWVLFRPSPSARVEPWLSLVSCGWAIFIVSILPVLGLIPFGFQNFSTVADHYLYVPLLGASVIVAGVLVRFRTSPRSRYIAAAPLLVFTTLSVQQAWLWRSTETLFAYTLKINPKSYLSSFCIGDELMRAGRLDEAIEWLEKSRAIKPDYLTAALTLGMAYTRSGEPGKAVDLYNATLGTNPSIVGARAKSVASIHNNLGMLLMQAGLTEAGVEHFKKAVAIFPRALNAHLNLGNVAFARQRYTDAVAEYETALSLSPDSPGIEQRLEMARRRAEPQ